MEEKVPSKQQLAINKEKRKQRKLVNWKFIRIFKYKKREKYLILQDEKSS
jgi:hypothetical protein